MNWRRAIILVLALAIYTIVLAQVGMLAMCAMGGAFTWEVYVEEVQVLIVGSFTHVEAISALWAPVVIVVATQVLFLWPIVSPRLALAPHGRPLKFSVLAAALVAGLLFTGLIAATAELVYLLRTGSTDVGDVIWESGLNDWLGTDEWLWWPFVLASWIMWMPLMWLFCRRIPAQRLHGRLVGWLFAGTIIEVLVILPLDIMVRRKSNCYCATGTFVALTMSIFAILWLTGPGILLALTSKRRRRWFDHVCPNCGYEKGPSPGEKCPECGTAWADPTRGMPPAAADLRQAADL